MLTLKLALGVVVALLAMSCIYIYIHDYIACASPRLNHFVLLAARAAHRITHSCSGSVCTLLGLFQAGANRLSHIFASKRVLSFRGHGRREGCQVRGSTGALPRNAVQLPSVVGGPDHRGSGGGPQRSRGGHLRGSSHTRQTDCTRQVLSLESEYVQARPSMRMAFI